MMGRAIAALGVAAAILTVVALPATSAMTMPAGDVQRMIDQASPGSMVMVPPGMHEGAVVVDRPLHLMGEPGATLDGGGMGSVLTIDAPDVEVSDLTIVGSGHGEMGAPSGILLTERADRAHVHDVAVRSSYLGVTVQRAVDVTLERISIVGEGQISGELHATGHTGHGVGDTETSAGMLRGDGIWLFDATRPVVRDCVIDTVRDGLYLSFGRGQVLDHNTVVNARYALHAMYATNLRVTRNLMDGNLSGLVIMYGGPVLATGNTITDSGSASTGFGAIVKDAGDVTLEGNVFADDRIGLDVDDAGRTMGAATSVVGNTIAMNQVGVALVPSADATFSRNALIENTTQVVLRGTGEAQTVWSIDGVGNYWSDYGGFDAHADGTGDLPYVRSGRTAQLIAADPQLLALASGPAFRLLMSVEDRWAPATAIVDDPSPLMAPVSPPVAGLDGETAGSLPLWGPGILMVVLGSWSILRVRTVGHG